jgi:hypothetical protein
VSRARAEPDALEEDGRHGFVLVESMTMARNTSNAFAEGMNMARNATWVASTAATAAVTTMAAFSALRPAHAHHSYAQFDRCTSVALEGEIMSVEWVNPHIRIDLKTSDVPSYFIEWFSLGQLQQAGIEAETLKAGDRVVVTGSAMRDPAVKLLSLLSEIRRPSDGWSWARAPRPMPTSCAAG